MKVGRRWAEPFLPHDWELAFEVAAIKPNKSGSNDSHWNDHSSKMTAANVTLRQLIAFAYGVHDFQISGPDWLRAEHYDIRAEGEAWASRDQRPLVLQNLLTDRFKLLIHRETKELPVYALVIAKDGVKLQRVNATGESCVSSSRGHMTLQKASMKDMWTRCRAESIVLSSTKQG